MKKLLFVFAVLLLAQGCDFQKPAGNLDLLEKGTVINFHVSPEFSKKWIVYEKDEEYATEENWLGHLPSNTISAEKGSRIEVWGKMLSKKPYIADQKSIVVQSANGERKTYAYDYVMGDWKLNE